MRCIGYVRVSTEEQATSGAGLEAQRTAITEECAQRGWALLEICEDAGRSARDLRRPGLRASLARVEDGEADTLVVAKLDRLSRSMVDFTALLARSRKQGWGLVALDVAMDTTSPTGEAMAHMIGTFAQLERRLIGQRTTEALEKKREAGVRLGRPREIDSTIEQRVRRYRADGLTFREIARRLDRSKARPPSGGNWQISTLARVAARS